MKKLLSYIILQAISIVVWGQITIPSTTGYEVRGDAQKLSCNCYMLSDLLTGQAGSVWFNAPIDLTYSFEFCFTVNFGNLDANGADGIVFALQQDKNAVGGYGVDMGIGGVKPSVFIEMDTYYNSNRNDPEYDHISIGYNGNNNHLFNGIDASNTNGGPLVSSNTQERFARILPDNDNVEDGIDHDFRVSWDSFTNTLTAYFDGNERFSYSGDIVQNIFNGNPKVYWGFTGGTGSLYNYQTFCIDLESDFMAINKRDNALRYCVEDSVHLTSSYNTCLSEVEWRRWDMGDGTQNLFDTVSALSHKYDAPGKYQVSLEVVDMDGCTQKDSISLEIVECTPIVDFEADTFSVCTNDTVVFTDMSSNLLNDTGYVWDFGEGAVPQIVKGKGPHNVIYTFEGLKNIKLSVIDELGREYSEIKEAYVTIHEYPSVNIGNDTTICFNETISIGVENMYDSYSWNTGSATETIQVSASGQYFLTVTHHGCSSVDSTFIQVADIFTIELPQDTSICQGDSIKLTVDNDDTFLWSTGSTEQSIWIGAEGDYWAEAKKGNCFARDTFHLHIKELPIISLDKDVRACNSYTISTNATLENYEWNTGENSPEITVTEAGTYWLKTEKANCVNTDSITVLIDKPFSFHLGNDTTICQGEEVTLTAPENDSCLWSNGEKGNSITITESGNYSLLVYRGMCSAEDAMELIVIPLKNAFVEVTPKIICEESPALFQVTDSSNGGKNPHFEWLIDNNVVSLSKNFQTYGLPNGTIVYVRMYSDLQCIDKSFTKDSAIVVASPNVQILYDSIACVSDSSTVVTLQGDTDSKTNIVPHSVLEKDGNNYTFVLQKHMKGMHAFTFTFTNEYECSSDTSFKIRVHDIEPPHVKEMYSDIVGNKPYKTLKAQGTGNLFWYDNTLLNIAQDIQEYYPQKNCSDDECEFIYYVNQVDNHYGCVSDYAKIRYIQKQCNVPEPIVFDTSVCDYATTILLRADTAQTWELGSPTVASSLSWYKNASDAYDAYIHKGFAPYKATDFYGTESQTYFVRQYNEGPKCYGAAVPITLSYKHASAPILEKNIITVCEGETDYEFIAHGENVQWFADKDSSKLPINAGMSFAPTNVLPSANPYEYYVLQTLNGCNSELTQALLYVHSKPIIAHVNDGEGCEGSMHSLQYNTSTDSIFWYGIDNKIVGTGNKLTLEENWLSINNETPFVIVTKNSFGCLSDPDTTMYTLYSKTAEPNFGEIPSVYCAGSEPIVLQNKNGAETFWLEGETLVHNGVIYTLPTGRLNAYEYKAYAQEHSCPSDTVSIVIAIEETPAPEIQGENYYCEQSRGIVFYAVKSNSANMLDWKASGDLFWYSYAENAAVFDFIDSGIDTISVIETSPNGCADSASLIVSVAKKPVANFSFVKGENATDIIFIDESSQEDIVEKHSKVEIDHSVYWDFNIGNTDSIIENYNSEAIYYEKGIYSPMQIAINEYGCSDSIVKELNITIPAHLFVPNSFAPDFYASQVQMFLPKGLFLKQYKLSIYDSWGNLIFYSDKLNELGSPTEGWNGKCDGQTLPSDIYIWKIDAAFKDGTTWKGVKDKHGKYKTFGSVFLIR